MTPLKLSPSPKGACNNNGYIPNLSLILWVVCWAEEPILSILLIKHILGMLCFVA